MKLRKKINVFLTAAFVIPAIIVSVGFVAYYAVNAKEKTYALLQERVSRAKEAVNSRINILSIYAKKYAEKKSMMLLFDMSIGKKISIELEHLAEQDGVHSILAMNNHFKITALSGDISFIGDYIKVRPYYGEVLRGRSYVGIEHTEGKDASIIYPNAESSRIISLAAVHPIKKWEGYGIGGIIVVSDKLDRSILSYKGGSVQVVSAKTWHDMKDFGNIRVHSAPLLRSDILRGESDSEYIVFTEIPGTDRNQSFYLTAFADKSVITGTVLRIVLAISAALILLITVLFLFRKYLFVNYIVPIEKQHKRLRAYSKGDTDTLIEIKGSGGLRYLNEEFNKAIVNSNNRDRITKQSEEFLRKIFDRMPAAVCLLDESGKVFKHNEEFRRMLGLSTDDAANWVIYDSFDYLSNKKAERDIGRTFKGGSTDELVEWRVMRKGGGGILAGVRLSLINIPSGRYTVCIMTDITNLRRQQQKNTLAAMGLEKRSKLNLVFDVLDKTTSLLRKPFNDIGLSVQSMTSENLPQLKDRSMENINKISRTLEDIKIISKSSGEEVFSVQAFLTDLIFSPESAKLSTFRTTVLYNKETITPKSTRDIPVFDNAELKCDRKRLMFILRKLVNYSLLNTENDMLEIEVKTDADTCEVTFYSKSSEPKTEPLVAKRSDEMFSPGRILFLLAENVLHLDCSGELSIGRYGEKDFLKVVMQLHKNTEKSSF